MPSPLTDKIRAKYPGAYDDMSDEDLEKAVLTKHPEYQDLAQPKEVPSMMKGGIFDPNVSLSQKMHNVISGPDDPNLKKLSVAQDIPYAKEAGDWIKNKAINTGNWYAGAAGSMLGDLVGSASIYPIPGAAPKPVSQFEAVPEIKSWPKPSSQKLLTGSENPPIYGPETLIKPSVSNQGYTMPGKPAELLHPNRMEPASEVVPTLDQIHSQPKVVTSPSDINKIPPGQAMPAPITNGKDIKPFRAEFSSPQVVMDNFPNAKPAVQPIIRAFDEKSKWLATTEREFAQVSQGLNSNDRKALFYILNGEEVPNVSPAIQQRAEQARNLFDSVWDTADDKNAKMGFIDRYITHIQAQPDDIQSSVRAMVDNQFGKNSGLYKIFSSGKAEKPTGEVGDIFEKGLGSPESVFTKKRTDALQDVETDYNKIVPIYLESMAKSIFDRPAVDTAKEALKEVPDGKLKEWLQGYIRNYSRYDSDAELASAWNSLANQIGNINARSVISFNPVIHMYHLGQLPAGVWPELGTKYSTVGLSKFVQNPISAYQELAKNGLFSNMIRPMQFQTPMQKFESAGYFMNMVESIVKGTGYYGFKQKFLDQGLNEAESTMRAIAATKDATATVDPARMMRFFTPESNVAGGQMMKLGKQYRQIPVKIIEQFSRAAADFQANPGKLARYVAGSSIAGAGAAAGLHTFHANPLSLIPELSSVNPVGGQFYTVMKNIYQQLGKGDVGGALGELITWATPGGRTAQKLIANQ